MNYLFDSSGRHIANMVNGQLHAITGKNIGHFMESEGFFIDMQGFYFGEIMFGDRLLYRLNNGFDNVSFGVYGNHGNTGSYGLHGDLMPIENIDGFSDIDIDKLK